MIEECPNELFKVAEKSLEASSKIIKKYFRKSVDINEKLDGTIVSVADKETETIIRAIISQECPEHGIIGEEFEDINPNSEFKWILDPIDGTQSFITGKPIFGTLIALYFKDKPILGIIDQPIINERWIGKVSNITTFNGFQIKTSTKELLSDCFMESTSPFLFDKLQKQKFLNLVESTKKTGWGSDCYAYGLLANGYIDIICESNLKFYDFAAIVPVIEGAGGKITDWQGNNLNIHSDGNILASANSIIHKKALKILQNN
ncbi:histidinol phosphate phosphatase [Alphaproteobacteria bacterium]|nr:histidinol phosphate phosphatase [Alphaproteobacteria bacterium]